MSLCQDCVKGVIHEGTPKGEWAEIGGVKSYIATPTGEYPKDKVLLYLPDVFGVDLINCRLLADGFAANGLKTIVPDYHNGDPIPADALEKGTFDFFGWLPNHTEEKTRPTLNKVLEALKAQGVKEFAATGYCFGARYTFDLAFENIIKVGVVAHPSLINVPQDFEKYVATSKTPLLLNSCTYDEYFDEKACAKADEVFAEFGPGYKREHWKECHHGFAVRGDISIPEVKAGKEGAFKATVEWIFKYL